MPIKTQPAFVLISALIMLSIISVFGAMQIQKSQNDLKKYVLQTDSFFALSACYSTKQVAIQYLSEQADGTINLASVDLTGKDKFNSLYKNPEIKINDNSGEKTILIKCYGQEKNVSIVMKFTYENGLINKWGYADSSSW